MQKFACSWTHAVQNHVGQGSTVYVEVNMEYMCFYFVVLGNNLKYLNWKTKGPRQLTIIFWKTSQTRKQKWNQNFLTQGENYLAIINFYIVYAKHHLIIKEVQ